MKQRLLIHAVMLFVAVGMYAQQDVESAYWYQMVPNSNADIRQIFDEAFTSSLQETDTSEGSGSMHARRFRYFWENRANYDLNRNNTSFSAADRAMDELYRNKEKYLKSGSLSNKEWKYIGRDSAATHCMGIVFSLAVDTSATGLNTIYAGTNASGLWKSTDGGKNWFNTTDNIGLPGMGVNDIVIDPSDANTLYMCTGITTYFRGYGIGIWKSADAGNSWERIWGEGTSSELARRLLINPHNTQIIYACINEKVLRSDDGGEQWTEIFSGIYQPHSWKTRVITDAVLKPGSGDTMFLISEGTQKYIDDSLYDFPPEIWQCINATDTSPEWHKIDEGNAWEYTKRASLAVTKAEPEFLYCSFTNNEESRYHLYRYNSVNDAWISKTDTTTEQLFQGVDEWRNSLLVCPNDTGIVYVGGYYVTKVMGDSIVQTGSFHDDKFHVDVRDMAIVSEEGKTVDKLFVGNDGGVSKSSDAAASWESINGKGLCITQYYDMDASETKPGFYAGGTQDNGIIMHNPDWDNPWDTHIVSDNYVTVINPSNTDIVYSLMFAYFPGLFVSHDGGLTGAQLLSYPYDEYVTQGWPLVMHPYDHSILYSGLRDVYRTTDHGFSWEKISNLTQPPHELDSSQKVEDLKVFRADDNIIYVLYAHPTYGSYTKKLFKTIDGGLNWTHIPVIPELITYRSITSIEVHPHDHNKAWITLGGFFAEGVNRIFYTEDSFSTWVDISEGLPNLPVSSVRVMDTPLNDLFLCNDAGVYYRNDSMQKWEMYGTGLPVCIVSDLEFDRKTNTIRIATFGRGLWEIEGMEPPYGIDEAGENNIISIFPNPAHDRVNIRYPASDIRYPLIIIDHLGRKKAEISVGNENLHSLDVSSWPAGMYFVKIKDPGQKPISKKLIIY